MARVESDRLAGGPSTLFIRRPIATTLLTIGVALLGIAAFFALPVAPLPQVDFPIIGVQANLPGASPEVMATSVATPLERRLGVIADLEQITSRSSNRGGQGSTQIILQFGVDRDANGAARDVQAAINAAVGTLAQLPSAPTYNIANPSDQPIIILTLSSNTLANYQVYDAASLVVQQAISRVEGVGEVDVFGSATPAVRVEMNPRALNKYGIGLEDVKAAVQSANAFSPKGSYSDGARRYQIDTNDQATLPEDYRNVVIAYRNGRPVRLHDVAEVVAGPQQLQNLGLENGKPAIIVAVTKTPGANIIATVDRINKMLPQLRVDVAQHGPVDLTVALDSTKTIRASLNEVERTLLTATLLVVVVVLVFLRNGRATLIPGVAVAVSLLGTLAVMYVLHYSLDNLSLMALTVSTGFVVDDAIVVLENITRHVEDGVPRYRAALIGAREVGFTVFSISMSLIAVFLPILAMGGLVGKLFREFAVTLTAAIVISLIVSLTTTPMMAAYLIDERPDGAAPVARRSLWRRLLGAVGTGFERGFNAVHRAYAVSLAWALDHSFLVLMSLIATVVLNFYLYGAVSKGFFPQQDTGLLLGGIQVDQASSFDLTSAKVRRLQKIVGDDPAVRTVTSYVQSTGGGMWVELKPRGERPGVTAEDVMNRIRPLTLGVSGAALFLQSAQDIPTGGRAGNAQYQYTLQSDSSELLKTWSDKLMRALQAYPAMTDVNSDQQGHALETYITYDRATAARLGLTPQQIDNTLNDAYGQAPASIIYNPLNQYRVVMEVAQRYQRDPETLKDIYVAAPSGGTTPATATTVA
ncbi:MAG: efflux RND transporter permease subunit, partial [Caulobacteraceae bacterium]